MAESLLAVHDLSFVWDGGNRVLNRCSLQVPTGQLWMLLGSNGSGKSTLLKLLAKLLKPQAGRVEIDEQVGFVFQNPDHQLVMPTVGADVAFGLVSENISYAETQIRVGTALAAVNLDGFQRRPIYALSGGQKQRVAIAGAIARQVKVLLLDEPTALLDRDSQIELVAAVKQLVKKTGITALWVTHRLNELEYADGAFLLEKGRVSDQGDPLRLRDKLQNSK
jgi:energy-coupling factor transport system ATP-binding protein